MAAAGAANSNQPFPNSSSVALHHQLRRFIKVPHESDDDFHSHEMQDTGASTYHGSLGLASISAAHVEQIIRFAALKRSRYRWS
jgi:hypothetical protein